MKTDMKERKDKAIELMKELDIFKGYIKDYIDDGNQCYFEEYIGFWAYQDNELHEKMCKLELDYDLTVYAVTHEYTEFGECYSFLIVPNDDEDWENLLIKDGDTFYAFAYVWNKTDDFCSEFGTIGVKSRYGGLKRVA